MIEQRIAFYFQDNTSAWDLADDDDACNDLLEHHADTITKIEYDELSIVSAAVSHCAALSSKSELAPETVLSLRTYQLDPSFLWPPVYIRDHVVAWARDFMIAQIAETFLLLSDLPDDCGGDIIEFLQLRMTRNELLDSSVHCSSPEARAWLRAVVVSAVAKENAVRALASY